MARSILNPIYFVSLFLMLIIQFDYTAAAYGSDQNCFLYEANSVTCPGGGTSNVVDVVARLIPSKAVFVLITLGSNVFAVIRSTLAYIRGFVLSLYFESIMGYGFNFSNSTMYAYLNLVKCPFIRPFNNNNETVPFTRTLTFRLLYEAISLSRQPQDGPCNIAGGVLVSDSPVQVADLDPAGAMDIQGTLSCSVRQLDTSPQDTAAAIRQTNSGGVNISENIAGNFVFVSQPSPISAPCRAADVAVQSDSNIARIQRFVQAAVNNPGAPNAICNIAVAGATAGVQQSTGLSFTFIKLSIIGPPKTIIAIYVYTTPLVFYGAFLALNRSC